MVQEQCNLDLVPMLKNYFITAMRSLRRHKGFSFINIAGLTLGLCASLLIALFVWDEWQYDAFVPGGKDIYRVWTVETNDQGAQNMAVTPPAFASQLRDFPAVEEVTRVMELSEVKMLMETGSKQLYETGGKFADSNFFRVFPFKFDFGSPLAALDDPGSVVLSREMAEKLFGPGDPVGNKILVDKKPLMVTGVFEMNPKFHLSFDFLRPLSAMNIAADRMQSWQWQQFFTYVKLRPGADPAALQGRFQELIQERAMPQVKNVGFSYVPFLQPLQDIYLHSSDFKFDMGKRGNITYVNALIIIAVFIVIIACFNFINLSTARAVRRAKEVGVRKSIGAEKRQLIFQFIGETMLVASVSTVLAIALTIAIVPWLNGLTEKNIDVSQLARPVSVLLLLLLIGVVGLLAGLYPALVLSRFEPVKVLKAGTSQGVTPGKFPWLRQGLVLVQFTLSMLLIISVAIVFRQVRYLHNKDLGFSKDQVMFFPIRGDSLFKQDEAFKNELLQSPDISNVSIGYGFPGDAVAGDEIVLPRNGSMVRQPVTQLTIDFDYIPTLGLQMVAGRAFSKDMATDKDHAWVINETAVKALGFGSPQKALGQTMYWHPWDGNNPDSLKVGQVIGVVKDFNYKSLYDKIEPAVLQIYPQAAWKVAVKLKGGHIDAAIADVKRVWHDFAPGYPIEYRFLDENFGEMYRTEDRLEDLLWVFTGIAIFIACLGLFGLAAFSAETRQKELGIRKVLGASAEGLVILLSKDFLRPVAISILVASPAAAYVMAQWLRSFAYRIQIGWITFALSGLVTILIALSTIAYQALRAAIANPIRSLRAE